MWFFKKDIKSKHNYIFFSEIANKEVLLAQMNSLIALSAILKVGALIALSAILKVGALIALSAILKVGALIALSAILKVGVVDDNR
jgi:hypothetical protein